MPLSASAHFVYGVDPDARLAVIQMAGTLTGADMQHIVETVHADPAWRDGFDAIWDCRAVQAHDVLPHEVGPLLDELVGGETGRDVLLEGPGLTADLFAQLLALRIRRRGGSAEVVSSMPDALGALGRDALPPALAERIAA